MIAIIDYGAGNLRSIANALQKLDADFKILHERDEFKGVDRIVLPGVGSFGKASQKLEESGFFLLLQEWIRADKSFLGICLGMQLLMFNSAESKDSLGLECVKGTNRRFCNVKVPHIGWNNVQYAPDEPVFKNIDQNSYFYFVHSYFIEPDSQDYVIGKTFYGLEFPSVIRRGDVYGVQFHPEKSGETGLQLLKNWVELC